MSLRVSHASQQASSARRVHPAWFVILAGLLLITIGLAGIAVLITPLPNLGLAPSYKLTNQDDQPVSDLDLRGHIVVYNFIYTSCTTICPAITGQMLQLHNQLAEEGWLEEEVILVTITFDPERDTPARLREYAAAMGAEADTWLWLTGDPMEVRQLVGGEFGVFFERVASEEGADLEHGHTGYGFIHDTAFIIVDEQGRVRAEYHDFPGTQQAMQDIRLLVLEKNAQGMQRLVWQMAHGLKDAR